MSTSFWQKDSLVTLILFELCLLWYLAQSQILVISLKVGYKESSSLHEAFGLHRYRHSSFNAVFWAWKKRKKMNLRFFFWKKSLKNFDNEKTALDRIPRYKRTALKEECLYFCLSVSYFSVCFPTRSKIRLDPT